MTAKYTANFDNLRIYEKISSEFWASWKISTKSAVHFETLKIHEIIKEILRILKIIAKHTAYFDNLRIYEKYQSNFGFHEK